MQKLSKLFLAFAIAATAFTAHAAEVDAEAQAQAQAQAAKRFAIHTEVTKGGKVVSKGIKEIQNGGTAQFSDAKFKEIDAQVTVNCRTGMQRWVQFYKPRCDEPVREVEKVAIGFNAEVGAREANEGNILLYVKGSYVDVISEYNLKGVEADLRAASFRDSSLNSNMIINPGEVVEITNGIKTDEIRLKLSITPI